MSLTEANRTVGSWILTDENRARRVIQGRRADGKPVTVCIIEDWVREEDAVLLAASRDLLAACKVAINSPACALGGHERQQISAAIAKATRADDLREMAGGDE